MRIAIANDSLQEAKEWQLGVEACGAHEVIWVARDGREAAARCETHTPDLLVMDLVMPVLNGVGASAQIMRSTPCGIVVVTSETESDPEKVFDALAAGAWDGLILAASNQGKGASEGQGTGERIHRKVNEFASSCTQDRQDGMAHAKFDLPRRSDRRGARGCDVPRVVVMGASAGGPSALSVVCGGIEQDFPAAMVVMQHLDPSLIGGFARWLQARTRLNVCVAQEGLSPTIGTIAVTSAQSRLVLNASHQFEFARLPTRGHQGGPLDEFFESVVRYWPGEASGVLLSGLGLDGARGLKAMRDHGCHTIAQDIATSAVTALPCAAAELRAAHEVLPADQIAGALRSAGTEIGALFGRTSRRLDF